MSKHVALMDINGDGILKEIVVMGIGANGDVHFIPVDHLDTIDIDRLRAVLKKRNADDYPLWDLLSNTTLANGVNALEFFDQFVLTKLNTGAVVQRGKGIGSHGMKKFVNRSAAGEAVTAQEKRGPGRPPKSS